MNLQRDNSDTEDEKYWLDYEDDTHIPSPRRPGPTATLTQDQIDLIYIDLWSRLVRNTGSNHDILVILEDLLWLHDRGLDVDRLIPPGIPGLENHVGSNVLFIAIGTRAHDDIFQMLQRMQANMFLETSFGLPFSLYIATVRDQDNVYRATRIPWGEPMPDHIWNNWIVPTFGIGSDRFGVLDYGQLDTLGTQRLLNDFANRQQPLNLHSIEFMGYIYNLITLLGANVNTIDPQSGETIFQIALERGANIETIDTMLVTGNVDLLLQNRLGVTQLETLLRHLSEYEYGEDETQFQYPEVIDDIVLPVVLAMMTNTRQRDWLVDIALETYNIWLLDVLLLHTLQPLPLFAYAELNAMAGFSAITSLLLESQIYQRFGLPQPTNMEELEASLQIIQNLPREITEHDPTIREDLIQQLAATPYMEYAYRHTSVESDEDQDNNMDYFDFESKM